MDVHLSRLVERVDFALKSRLSDVRAANLHASDFEDQQLLGLRVELALTHARSVVALCRADATLLPSGWVCARACIEAALMALWLSAVEGLEREGRVIALIDEAARVMGRLPDLVGDDDDARAWHEAAAARIRDISAVRREAAGEALVVPSIPKTTDLAESVGGSALRERYILASQFVHSTQFSVAVQPGLAGAVTDGAHSWALLLSTVWDATQTAFNTLVNNAPVPISFDATAVDAAVEAALAALTETVPRD